MVLDDESLKGSLHGHFNRNELYAWVESKVERFPHLLKWSEIGRSVQNRPLHLLCVGVLCQDNDEQRPDPRGEILFTALHHAREPLGLMALVAYIQDLLDEYSRANDTVVHLVENRTQHFMLLVNPDGYVANERGAGMIRKSFGQASSCKIRKHVDDGPGVDLNRNYDFCFGKDHKGSSTNPCAIDYQGPRPFSEPETQAVKNVVEKRNFKVAFNYHSFGKEIYIPYSCKPMGKTPDEAFFRAYAKRLKETNGYNYGQPWNSGLYTVNGDAADWMYSAHGIIAVSPEMAPADPVSREHDGFWVEPALIPRLARATVPMNYIGAWTVRTFLYFEQIQVLESSGTTVVRGKLYNHGVLPHTGLIQANYRQGENSSLLHANQEPSITNLKPKGGNYIAISMSLLACSDCSVHRAYFRDETECVIYTISDKQQIQLVHRVAATSAVCEEGFINSSASNVAFDSSEAFGSSIALLSLFLGILCCSLAWMAYRCTRRGTEFSKLSQEEEELEKEEELT